MDYPAIPLKPLHSSQCYRRNIWPFSPLGSVSSCCAWGSCGGFVTSCRFLFPQGSAALPYLSVCLCMQLMDDCCALWQAQDLFSCVSSVATLQTQVSIAAGDQYQPHCTCVPAAELVTSGGIPSLELACRSATTTAVWEACSRQRKGAWLSLAATLMTGNTMEKCSHVSGIGYLEEIQP